MYFLLFGQQDVSESSPASRDFYTFVLHKKVTESQTSADKKMKKPLGCLKVTMAACSSGIMTILSGKAQFFSKYSSNMSGKESEIINAVCQ